MDTWTILRLLKFLSVALFAGGVLLSTGARARADRLDAAWTLAPLGFLGAWLSGYGMMKATGVSMGAGWISGSMLASIAALQLSQLGAEVVGAGGAQCHLADRRGGGHGGRGAYPAVKRR